MDEATARAHAERCFRGAYEAQMQGNLDEAIGAIRECRKTIRVDPDFGNPNTDIASYPIKLGRHEQAISRLRKVMVAPRNGPRHYPHVNLTRVSVKPGKVREAIAELE